MGYHIPVRTRQLFDRYGSKLYGNISRSHRHALNDINPQKLVNPIELYYYSG